MVLCNIRESCVCCLRWFHSKWHLSTGKKDNNSPNKWLILSAVAWWGSKERFSSTKLSLGTIDSQSFQSRHAEVKVQGMPFLLGADSSAVKSPSKENTLKSMPLKMTSPKKTHSANRDGQSKAVQEATSSCQAACHNTHPQFFPSEILRTLLEPAGCCSFTRAALQKRGAGCASPCLFSPEKGKYPSAHTLTLRKARPDAEGARCFPVGCAGGPPNQALLSQQQL